MSPDHSVQPPALPPSPTKNLWSLLPIELQSRILDFSSLLTQHLHHRIPSEMTIYPFGPAPALKPSWMSDSQWNQEIGFQIWRIAFEEDWKENLELLKRLQVPKFGEGLGYIKSRDFLERVRRSDAMRRWSGREEVWEVCLEDWVRGSEVGQKEVIEKVMEIWDTSWKHVAMRRGWWDMLGTLCDTDTNEASANNSSDDVEDPDCLSLLRRRRHRDFHNIKIHHVTAHLYLAIIHGHYEYLRFLVQTQGVEPKLLKMIPWLHSAFNTLEDEMECPRWGFGSNPNTPTFFSPNVWLEPRRKQFEMARKTLVWADPVSIAAARCDLRMLEYLVSECGCTPHRFSTAIDDACTAESIHLNYFHEMDPAPTLHLQKNVRTIQYLCTNFPSLRCTRTAMDSAASKGDLSLLLYLRRTRTEGCSYKAMDLASQNGHVEVVRFLLGVHQEHAAGGMGLDTGAGFFWSEKAMDLAASRGHLEVLRVLQEASYIGGATVDALDSAAANGHLEVVKYLHSTRTEGCTTKAMDEAASNGFLDVVKFLNEERSEGCTIAALTSACKNGHLDVVRYLHSNRTEGTTIYALDAAAAGGHVGVVLFLLENRMEGFSMDALRWAVGGGWVEVVKVFLYLEANSGCLDGFVWRGRKYGPSKRKFRVEWPQGILDVAAASGSAEVFELLCEAFDKKKVEVEAEGLIHTDAVGSCISNGHLEVLKRMEKRFPDLLLRGLNVGCLRWAGLKGEGILLRYLNDKVLFKIQGTLWMRRTMEGACEGGQLDVVEYLSALLVTRHDANSVTTGTSTDTTEYDCTPQSIYLAAVNNHAKVLKFLHARFPHVPWPPDTLHAACEKGCEDVVAYMFKSGLSRADDLPEFERLLEAALEGGHVKVVQLLVDYFLKCQIGKTEADLGALSWQEKTRLAPSSIAKTAQIGGLDAIASLGWLVQCVNGVSMWKDSLILVLVQGSEQSGWRLDEMTMRFVLGDELGGYS
ncbi:hypothetical protein HDV05_000930 [Chytridiales sp. JEL 0842]|nr:hypothetical protein HDV05_000930 [Chytridiales sp. JEL 0842]